MLRVHAKSSCCKAKIYHFGKRRRQCSRCKRTWRVHLKRRGRKRVRVHPLTSGLAFSSAESLRHRAKRLRKGRELVRRRHARRLELLLKKLPEPRVPSGRLIAVIDGYLVFFKGQPYTLYLTLLRSVKGNTAVVAEPTFLPGYETIGGWRVVFSSLPGGTQKRICAVVSDGVIGVKEYARQRGWIYQRCHFHLLKTLYPLLGKRWRRVKGKMLRQNVYQKIYKILTTPSQQEADTLFQEVTLLTHSANCPPWFGLRARGMLKGYHSFRSYLKYPELSLPTTVNAAESVFSVISETIRRTRNFRNPQAFEKWVRIRIRLMKPIKCNGKIQPN